MSDPHVELIASEIAELGGRYDLLEESTLPYTFRGHVIESRTGHVTRSLRYRGRSFQPTRYAGAYLRHIDTEAWELPDELSADDCEALVMAWISFVREVLEAAIPRLINPMEASLTNFYKPLQLDCLARAGFHVPRSLLTCDPDAARRFIAKYRGRVIFKSASGVRSIVRLVRDEDLERLELLHKSPSLFQEFIEGTHARVHCVGNRVFGVGIKATAVDYRYSGGPRGRRAFFPLRIPDSVKSNCITVSRMLGMNFSGVDLIITRAKKWYALEVNPDPAFSWFQRASGVRISKGVAEYLMGLRD